MKSLQFVYKFTSSDETEQTDETSMIDQLCQLICSFIISWNWKYASLIIIQNWLIKLSKYVTTYFYDLNLTQQQLHKNMFYSWVR